MAGREKGQRTEKGRGHRLCKQAGARQEGHSSGTLEVATEPRVCAGSERGEI